MRGAPHLPAAPALISLYSSLPLSAHLPGWSPLHAAAGEAVTVATLSTTSRRKSRLSLALSSLRVFPSHEDKRQQQQTVRQSYFSQPDDPSSSLLHLRDKPRPFLHHQLPKSFPVNVLHSDLSNVRSIIDELRH